MSPSAVEACPKCGGAIRVDACVRCGLARAAMDGFCERVDDGAGPELVEAWARIEARWDDDAAHEALVAAASSARAMPWAARRYRLAAAARPDDVRAPAMQQRLARLAEAVAMIKQAPPAPSKRWRGVIAIVVIGIVVVTAGAMIARIGAAPAPRPSPQRLDPPRPGPLAPPGGPDRAEPSRGSR